MFNNMWDVKEPKHYSKRVGREVPGVVAVLCVVNTGPMLIAVNTITEMVILYKYVEMYCNVIVLNSVFCLNCGCVLMISLYWERFYIQPARYRYIDYRYIQRYTGNIVISQIVIVYLNCINRGALELTKTIMCKPQVQNSDYHLTSTLTRDPYLDPCSGPLPLTLTLDPRPAF